VHEVSPWFIITIKYNNMTQRLLLDVRTISKLSRYDKPIARSSLAKKQPGIYNEIAFSDATMNSKFGCILHEYTRRNACDDVTEELVDSCGLD